MKYTTASVRTSLAAIVAAALICPLAADTVKLTDGTTLVGELKDSTDPKTVSIEVPIKPGSKIKDLKIIDKSKVLSVVKEGPDDLAAEVVKKMLPTGDLVRSTEYKKLIETGPDKFLAQYPTSKRAKEVLDVKKTLEEEMAKVRQGMAKLEGKWLTADERVANEYNLSAFADYASLKKFIAEADYRGALHQFQAMETKSKFSTYVVKSIDLAVQAGTNYRAFLDEQVKSHAVRLKQRNDGLKNLDPDAKTKADAAIKKGELDYRLALSTEKKDKTIKFLTLDTFKLNLPSLTEALKQVDTELARLNKLDKVAWGKSAEAYAEVLKLIAEKRYAEAVKQMEQFIAVDKSAASDPALKQQLETLRLQLSQQLRDQRNKELLEKQK
jgi:hypothetical protein